MDISGSRRRRRGTFRDVDRRRRARGGDKHSERAPERFFSDRRRKTGPRRSKNSTAASASDSKTSFPFGDFLATLNSAIRRIANCLFITRTGGDRLIYFAGQSALGPFVYHPLGRVRPARRGADQPQMRFGVNCRPPRRSALRDFKPFIDPRRKGTLRSTTARCFRFWPQPDFGFGSPRRSNI